MSTFKPLPLASNARTTRLSDLESNLRSATAIVGGTSYLAGTTTGSVPGAIGAENIKTAPWITNDRKTEPYALTVCSACFESVGPGATVVAVVPGVSSLVSPSTVSFSMVYGAISGGPANINGTLSISVCAATSTFTNIAPYATFTAVSNQAYVAPADGAIDGIVVTFTNSSGTATVSDVVVTIVLKCKHIA